MGSYFVPFGVASTTCIGSHSSILEISKYLPALVRSFQFELVDGKEGWRTLNHSFVMPLGFNVKMKPAV